MTVEPIDLLQKDERAADAQDLLDNALLQEIFRRLQDEAIDLLTNAVPGSVEAVNTHYRLLAIRAIEADLHRLVEDQKMLRAAAERRRKLSQ